MSVAENEDVDSVKEYLKNKIARLREDDQSKENEDTIKEAEKALEELGE